MKIPKAEHSALISIPSDETNDRNYGKSLFEIRFPKDVFDELCRDKSKAEFQAVILGSAEYHIMTSNSNICRLNYTSLYALFFFHFNAIVMVKHRIRNNSEGNFNMRSKMFEADVKKKIDNWWRSKFVSKREPKKKE